ncbi:MAG TPA: LamG-like jellyroll fold domain-containing protein, partial [Rariglobus sp.]
NGVADATAPTITLSAIQSNTASLIIGTRSDTTSATESLQGRLDQVTIHNRALSAAEVLQLVQ